MAAPVLARRTLLSAGLITLTASIAACGSSGPQAGGGSGGDPSVWIMTGTTEEVFRNSFEGWNAEHADRAFSIESYANDAYKQKIRTALGSGNSPTLVYGWGGGVLTSYVADGLVEDLSDLVADGRFLSAVAQTGQVDGKTYAVPNNAVKPVMVYYNKDLFAQVGAEPPATWDDLMALVPAFVDAGIAPFTTAGQARWPLLPWLAYLVDRVGGPEVMSSIVANTPDGWSDPAVLQATEMIQAFVDAGGFVDGFASISSEGGADTALLYTGRAAMALGLPATYQNIRTAAPEFLDDGKLGWFPFPAVTGGAGDPANVTGNPTNYWSIAASASDEQKQIARDYIAEQLMNEEYVAELLATGNVPPVQGAESAISASAEADYFSAVYELAAGAPSFQLSLDQALSPEQGEALLNNLQQVFLGQLSPEEFSTAMNATIEG